MQIYYSPRIEVSVHAARRPHSMQKLARWRWQVAQHARLTGLGLAQHRRPAAPAASCIMRRHLTRADACKTSRVSICVGWLVWYLHHPSLLLCDTLSTAPAAAQKPRMDSACRQTKLASSLRALSCHVFCKMNTLLCFLPGTTRSSICIPKPSQTSIRC
jgi:hypothetical protein